ncbi:MAG: hypothetical protein HC828_03365 [Blastochloris sp.]|nr:hypothetical protein [Blastochloris sp.]
MFSLLRFCSTFVVLITVAAGGIGMLFAPPVAAAELTAAAPHIVAVQAGEHAGFRGAFVTLADGNVVHARLAIGQAAPQVGPVAQMIVYKKCMIVCMPSHVELTDATGEIYAAYVVEQS